MVFKPAPEGIFAEIVQRGGRGEISGVAVLNDIALAIAAERFKPGALAHIFGKPVVDFLCGQILQVLVVQ